jgi:hypothetical protein
MSKYIPEDRVIDIRDICYKRATNNSGNYARQKAFLDIGDSLAALLATAVECMEVIPAKKPPQYPDGKQAQQTTSKPAVECPGCARLRDKLDEYGIHKATCAIHDRTPAQIDACEWPACTCGFDAALKQEGKP